MAEKEKRVSSNDDVVSSAESAADSLANVSPVEVVEVTRSSVPHSLQLIQISSQSNCRCSTLTSSSSSSTDADSPPAQPTCQDVDFPPRQVSLYTAPPSKTIKKLPLHLRLMLGLNKSSSCKNVKEWRQSCDITHQNDTAEGETRHQMYSRSTSSQDVLQGSLGSCWFIAALCLMAERPELLAKNLISLQYNPNGFHQIRLCQRGQWTNVTIDDYLPCDKNGQLVFSHSRRNDYWVPFLEKALAKLYGSYEAIESGSCVEGLQTLTGEPCEIVSLETMRETMAAQKRVAKLSKSSPKSPMPGPSDSTASLWLKLLNARQRSHLMLTLCVNTKLKSVEMERHGLLKRHVYSILDVQEIENGYEETIKLIKLRNPWGQKEWKGEWSNNWPGWPANIKSRLLPDNGQDESSRGSFWMSFKDVVKYFYDITICKVRSNGWYESRQSSFFGHFKSSSQAYLLNIDGDQLNEHEFEFELFAAGRGSCERTPLPEIDLCLVLCRIVTNDQLECVGFVHEVEYFTSMSKRLPVGNYILFPCSFRAISKLAKEKSPRSSSPPNLYKYNLIVHGQCNFKLSQMELQPTQVADLFHSVALRPPGNFVQTPFELTVKPKPRVQARSLVVSSNLVYFMLVENLSTDQPLRVTVDLGRCKNFRSTRDSPHHHSTVVQEYLAPKTRQLMVYLTCRDYRKSCHFHSKIDYHLLEDVSSSSSAESGFFSSLHIALPMTTSEINRIIKSFPSSSS